LSCVRADPRVLIEQMNKLHGVKEVADYTLEDLESEVKFGQLSGDDYVDVRLRVYLDRFEAEAESGRLPGPDAAILQSLYLRYWVSTALLSALAAYNTYSPMEQRVEVKNLALLPSS
jgi:hypothetical protein